jgi:hypothetical protein
MATIRAYTDISQSKTLSKILPLESADMCYEVGEDLDGYITKTIYTPLMHTPYNDDYIPCWSLAALLSVLSEYTLKSNKFYGKVALWCQGISVECNNTVDTCYEMILKLHELNLL